MNIKEKIASRLKEVTDSNPIILPNSVYLGKSEYRMLEELADWPSSEDRKGHICGLQIFLVKEETHLFIPPTYYKPPLA